MYKNQHSNQKLFCQILGHDRKKTVIVIISQMRQYLQLFQCKSFAGTDTSVVTESRAMNDRPQSRRGSGENAAGLGNSCSVPPLFTGRLSIYDYINITPP